MEASIAQVSKELEKAQDLGQKALSSDANGMKAALGELSLIAQKCQQLLTVAPSAPAGGKAEKPSRRRGYTVDSVPSAPPPPAMTDFIPSAPDAPPPPMVLAGGDSGTSLLTQIREGKQLQKVDIGRLRQERARQSRKSMAISFFAFILSSPGRTSMAPSR